MAFEEAIVLAGGLGTRLRPVVADRPKGLAEVAGRPFLRHQLAALRRQGVRRVVLALGYRAAMIRDALGDQAEGVDLAYSLEDHPLGTGGALRRASTACHTPRVLALNGDTFLEFAIEDLDRALRPPAAAAMVLTRVDDIARYGAVERADGWVVGFREKGGVGPGWINGGVYALDLAGLTAAWPAEESFSFERAVLPSLASSRRLAAVETSGRFLDIGTPEDYARAAGVLAPDPLNER